MWPFKSKKELEEEQAAEQELEEEQAAEQAWQSRLQIFALIKAKFPIGKTFMILGIQHTVVMCRPPKRFIHSWYPGHDADICCQWRTQTLTVF
jgi:hypothetical protein